MKNSKPERKPYTPFTKEDVTKIYFGGNHCCRCGCKGEYFYPNSDPKSFNRNFNRGIKLLVEMFDENEWDDGGTYVNIPTSTKGEVGKSITIYFD